MSCSGAEVDFARSLAVPQPADIVLRNGKIVTMDRNFSIKEAVAIKDGRFLAVGSERDMRIFTGPRTRVVDLGGRTVIPGLIDAQIEATVAGMNWDGELHWERLRTLADGLRLVAKATERQTAGSWIVVAGGWAAEQFAENRLPTRSELDAVAPQHPVYLQYLRQDALLNSAGLKMLGITTKSAEPAGGKFERDAKGELTGWLRGAPAWQFALAKLPKPSLERARESLRKCFGELSRLGITSIGDMQSNEVTFAHRRILAEMARTGELPLRVNFYISADGAGDELAGLKLVAAELKQLPQNDWFRFAGFATNLDRGAGESDRRVERDGAPLAADEKDKLSRMVRFFADGGYSFRLRTTRDSAAQDSFELIEQVHTATPLSRQRIAIADLDEVSAETIERVKKLGAGIAVQSRMALTGERFVELWGAERARHAPPLRKLLEAGIAIGAGSDGFQAGNYSPMVALWWLVTGKSVAGTAIRDRRENVSRQEALRMYTLGSAWFSAETQRKGSIEVDKFADLVVLNADYLTVPDERILSLESLLTMVGGRVVHFANPFGPIEVPKR